VSLARGAARAPAAQLMNKVVSSTIDTYDSLIPTGKPRNDEWTCLAGIVVQRGERFDTLAIGTGSKVTPAAGVATDGTSIQDSHAEVICRRAFQRYLCEEMLHLLKMRVLDPEAAVIGDDQLILQFCKQPDDAQHAVDGWKPFRLRPDVSLHMYVSQSPCGDSCVLSTEEDWSNKRTHDDASETGHTSDAVSTATKKQRLPTGNAFVTGADPVAGEPADYDVLNQRPGIVRGKPGRGPYCVSVSCSDKIARWNVLGTFVLSCCALQCSDTCDKVGRAHY
jgi:tRNA-specific adenosine deaminase 1